MISRGTCALIALSFFGCAASGESRRADEIAAQQRIDALQERYLRARRTIRDLQNRIIVLEDELDEQPDRNRPNLPVEVVGPPAVEGARAEPQTAAPLQVEGERLVIEGSPAYEGDVEVIYEGEAARDSGRPSVDLDGRLARNAGRAAAPAPAAAPPQQRVAGTAPRLPVTEYVPRLPSEGEATVSPPVQARAANMPPRRRRGASPDSDLDNGPHADVDPRTMYKRHYDALRAGDHAAAIAGFRAFIAEFPDHDYADNAQYWLGEAYYDQRKYREALAEFERVGERFPDGNKVPDAMLKVAFCHRKLGDSERARAVLRRIVAEHPKTNPAALAADRLSVWEE